MVSINSMVSFLIETTRLSSKRLFGKTKQVCNGRRFSNQLLTFFLLRTMSQFLQTFADWYWYFLFCHIITNRTLWNSYCSIAPKRCFLKYGHFTFCFQAEGKNPNLPHYRGCLPNLMTENLIEETFQKKVIKTPPGKDFNQVCSCLYLQMWSNSLFKNDKKNKVKAVVLVIT